MRTDVGGIPEHYLQHH